MSLAFILGFSLMPPTKIKMSPEKGPFQKEVVFQSSSFKGHTTPLIFGGGVHSNSNSESVVCKESFQTLDIQTPGQKGIWAQNSYPPISPHQTASQ